MAAPAQVDPTQIIRAAAQNSVPPAILQSMMQSAQPGFGIPPAVLATVGLTPQDVQQNPQMALEMIASLASQQFEKYGDWNQALSAVYSGDPQAYLSPTSPIGGMVAGVLGQAAKDPGFGMQSFTPANPEMWSMSANAFTGTLHQINQAGGVVTQQHLDLWGSAVQASTMRGSYAGASGGNDPIRGQSNAPGAIRFAAMPFDPNLYTNAHRSEAYKDTSGPGGYSEQGNDFTMEVGTPIYAPVSGTLSIINYGTENTGLTAYISQPDGGKVYIGHLSDVSLKNGQTVQAGQQFASSGGQRGTPNSGNSTGAHIEIGYIDATGQVHDPQPILNDAMKTQFANDVLKHAGLPQTPTNVAVLRAMQQGEGTNARWNPMATSQRAPGSTGFNTSGVQNFDSYQQGVAATAQTLANGNYANLLTGMRQGQSIGYFATNPGVQQDLQTWQGGGNSDITQIQQTAATGVPNLNPGAPQPKEVSQFASTLQQAGVQPEDFSRDYPGFAAAQRALLAKNTMPADYLEASQALRAQGKDVNQTNILDWLQNQPHPQFVGITAGQYNAMRAMAMLHSVPMMNRTPQPFEVGMMASAKLGWGEVQTFYQNMQKAMSNPSVVQSVDSLHAGFQAAKGPTTQQGQQQPFGLQPPDRQGGPR